MHATLSVVSFSLSSFFKGHTHVNQVMECEGRWYINPGSITGAYGLMTSSEVTPSFILMAIQGPKVTTYVYELKGDSEQVEVSKSEYRKS